MSVFDVSSHTDETRSNSPPRDEHGVGAQTPARSAADEINVHDKSSPKGSSRDPRRSKTEKHPWAAIDHAPGAYEHGLGDPMPDDRRDSEIDSPQDHPYPQFAGDLPWSKRKWWYELMPGRGMYYDFRRRLPFLVSDWTTAFEPRNWYTVAQYVIRMYFINLMPAISYILDMNFRTDGAYGLNEVILASALAALVFPIFSIQPLTFVGVTGLINLVNYTQYDIVVGYYGLSRMDYLRVQAWSLIWAAFFHFLVAIFNICDYTRFITDMTSQTFGFYVGIVYIQKGIELIIREYEPAPLDNATGWLSVTIAILFTVSVYLVTKIGQTSFGPFRVRYFISSFAFAAGCVFWTGFSHFPKNSLERVPIERLPITRAFFPSTDRSWFIDFWNIEIRWVFVGAPLGFLIMLLFYFDHNVSSVMAQARQFPVKRPAGFHWDFFLLGITTLVSGFLGLPAPNGLVPQCPWSTDSLSVYKQVDKGTHGADEEEPLVGVKGKRFKRQHIANVRVVENRVGHLLVGALTLATMTRPFLVALGTMPRALFAGIFILVGWSSIEDNVITTRTLALFQDRRLSRYGNGLLKVRRSKIGLFVGIQWVFFAMTFAISNTIAAIGFPVIIVLLIPFRYYVVPMWFSPSELRILDAPTADADVVLASLGHETDAVTGQGQRIARDTKIAGTEWPNSDDEFDDDEDNGAGVNTRKTRAPGAKHGNVQGYTIGDEDEEDSDVNDQTSAMGQQQQRGATPFEVDPEGHYRNWVQQDNDARSSSPGPGSKAFFGAGAASAATGAAAFPCQEGSADEKQDIGAHDGQLKESKRSKSVTQSWWGRGGGEPVQRAATPKEKATNQEAPSGDSRAGAKSRTKEAGAAAVAGGGLGAWFSRKKATSQSQVASSDAHSEHGMSESPVQMSQIHDGDAAIATGADTMQQGDVHHTHDHQTAPANLPGANFTEPPLPTQPQSAEGPNLFSAHAQSPNEAGANASNAVRDMQTEQGRSSNAHAFPSGDIAMPSNLPINIPHAAGDQHRVSIDPQNPHHIRIQSPHPGTSIDLNRGQVNVLHDDAPENARADEHQAAVDGSKEGKEDARLLSKEIQKTQKDEKKLRNLVRRQSQQKEASDLKREKLEAQLRAIEEKAALAKAAQGVGAEGTADEILDKIATLPRSLLTPLAAQVAGHEAGVYTIIQDSYVVKPCYPAEAEFYQEALFGNSKSISKSQRKLLKRLQTFLPTYHGLVDIVNDDSSTMGQPTNHLPLGRAIILENLSRDYNYANILDVKLGKQLWDEGATDAKRARMDEVAAKTTSGSSGIRLTGWQTWDPVRSTYSKTDKTFGKSIQAAQLETGLRCFFGLGSDADAQVVTDHCKQRFVPSHLPAKNLEAIIHEGILPAIDEIIDIVKKLHWRMRGGSVLIAFEGEPSIVSMTTKSSDLWAGRRSASEHDNQVTLADVKSTPVVAPALRLVDVRLIDFAHTKIGEVEGRDEGLLSGLETLRTLLSHIAKDARKGKIGKKDLAFDGVVDKANTPVQTQPVEAEKEKGAPTASPLVAASRPTVAAKDDDASRRMSKDDARSVRSEKRKSRGFFGIFRGKNDKSEDAAETKQSASKVQKQDVSQQNGAKSDSAKVLPAFAFERDGGDAQREDLTKSVTEHGKDNSVKEEAAGIGGLAALGAGGAYLAQKEHGKGIEGGDKQKDIVEPDELATAPVTIDKGKSRAYDETPSRDDAVITDKENKEREHPHGKGLNALLHEKGVVGNDVSNVSEPVKAVEPKGSKEDSHDGHGKAVGAGTAAVGAGVVASGVAAHDDSSESAKDADGKGEEPVDGKADKTSKRGGMFGLFKKSSKDQVDPSKKEDVHVLSGGEAARGQSREDAEKQLHDEAEARQRYHENAVAAKHSGEQDDSKDAVPASGIEGLRGESREEAEKKLNEQGDARQAYHEQAVSRQHEKDRPAGVTSEATGPVEATPASQIHEEAPGQTSEADEAQATESSDAAKGAGALAAGVTAASGIEALRGESREDAEKKFRDQAESRQAYRERALSGEKVGEHDPAAASGIEALRGESRGDAQRKLDEEAEARKAYHEKAVEGAKSEQKDSAPAASGIEALRGQSREDAEHGLESEAEARKAYHDHAVAQSEEHDKKTGFLGLFKPGAPAPLETPPQVQQQKETSHAAEAEGEVQPESEETAKTTEQAVLASEKSPSRNQAEESTVKAAEKSAPTTSGSGTGEGAVAAIAVADDSKKHPQAATKGADEQVVGKTSQEGRRRGLFGFFKKNDAGDDSKDPASANDEKEVESPQAARGASAKEEAGLVAGGGSAAAAIASADHSDQKERAREDARTKEEEARRKKEQDDAEQKQARERKLLAEAAAVRREESENAKARERKAIEDAKLREKRQKEEAKLAKRRQKEDDKQARKREKEAHKKAKEEEKVKREQEKRAEKDRLAAAAALQQKEQAERKEQERKAKQQKEDEARRKKAAEEAEALKIKRNEVAALESQRQKEAAELEKTRTEAADIEKRRALQEDELGKHRKDADELQGKLKKEEAAMQKQKDEIASLEKRIQQERDDIAEQHELALKLDRQKQQEQAALEGKHEEAAELERKRLEETAILEQRQRENAEADKDLQAKRDAVAKQDESFAALQKQSKDAETALQKQKEEAERIAKEQAAVLALLESKRKETETLEEKRHDEEAKLEKSKAEAEQMEKKRLEEEELLKKHREEAEGIHKRAQEEAAALEKARKELEEAQQASKKELAEIEADRKEAEKLHKKAEKEAAALKVNKGKTAKLHEKVQQEQAALEKAQQEAAAAEEARKKEAAALEKAKADAKAADKAAEKAKKDAEKAKKDAEKMAEKAKKDADKAAEQARKDAARNDNSTAEKAAAGAVAVPAVAALLSTPNKNRDKDEQGAKNLTSAQNQESSLTGSPKKPARFFGSLRRKSQKAVPSAEAAPPVPPVQQAQTAEQQQSNTRQSLPSFSGAPAGGVAGKDFASEAVAATGLGAVGAATLAHESTSKSDKASKDEVEQQSSRVHSQPAAPPSTKQRDDAAARKSDEEARSEHKGGLFGFFKGRPGKEDAKTGQSSRVTQEKPKPTLGEDKSLLVGDNRGFYRVGPGRKGVANDSVHGEEPAASGTEGDPASSWPTPASKGRKSVESTRTTGSHRSKRAAKSGAASAATPGMTTVEEIVEQTKGGPRTYLVHTNPPRGPGKAPSAVQWR